AHDGFTLMDLVSYNGKHNEANGWNNTDGANDNHSWNCGWEGPSTDPNVNALRHRQIKNFATLLMVSQGVPMILMGDEVGRTQNGNNNTYCQDNLLNWFDWSLVESNADLLKFFQNVIAFRRAHPVLRSRTHFAHSDYTGSGLPDISFHGTEAWKPDWSGGNQHTLAFMLSGDHAKGGTVRDDHIYVAVNTYWDALSFGLPQLPRGARWHVAVNTSMPSGQDIWQPGSEPLLGDQTSVWVGNRSVVVLVGR
ncbi:MAG: glycogen debranching enzyme, partial [Anaerolinea sp.]|nr:glycogen debranching enzyme [Anaerolinea sp.]